MPDLNDEELQDPSAWDFDRAEARAETKRPRAVVSVGFQREEYDRVAALAQEQGMRVLEYIRAAALNRIEQPGAVEGAIRAELGLRTDNVTRSSSPARRSGGLAKTER